MPSSGEPASICTFDGVILVKNLPKSTQLLQWIKSVAVLEDREDRFELPANTRVATFSVSGVFEVSNMYYNCLLYTSDAADE